MKKVLLINPSYKINKSSKSVLRIEPPIALLNLASFILDKGYESEIINTAIDTIPYDNIKNNQYALIGFTVFIGEFMKNSKQIINKIKEINPLIPICFGGVMPSIYAIKILEEYPIDYIIRYEGEYTLYELLEYLHGKPIMLDSILGLSYKTSNNVIINNKSRYLENELDKFPIPKWELLGSNCNQQQIPYYFRIMSSKGCPFKCSFCYSHSIDEEIRNESPTWRYRSANHIIKETDHIYKLTGTKVFTFGDDNFLVKKDRVQEIMNYMKNNGFYIEQCIAHMNNLKDDIIEMMSGVVQTVIYAIESASPDMLKRINKNLDITQIPIINKKLRDNGITTAHNFIVGLPHETDVDLKANVQLMIKLKEINPYVRAVSYMFLPLPFTPLTDYIKTDMNYYLPETLNDFETATFDSGNPDGHRFRPWLSKERYDTLHKYCLVFDDVFKLNNQCLSDETLQIFEDNPKIKSYFTGIENINKPKYNYQPYILDRVLRNEEIDIKKDFQDKLK